MDRQITHIVAALDVIDDGDMHLRRALPQPERQSVGPFVFVDHYRHESLRGIGDRPHPHAGIEVISYLINGAVEHHDSFGNVDRLGANDAQYILAGSGMLHAEQPLSGRHGLQLWTSLPPSLNQSAPRYQSLPAAAIPGADDAGRHVRVLAGQVNEWQGPLPLNANGTFAFARVSAGSDLTLGVQAGLELGLYVVSGSVRVGATALTTGTLGVLSNGTALTIRAAGETAAEVALIGGDAVTYPLLFSGPFVMDTREKLAQAKRDYAEGRMGRLDGVPF
jgi:redox-sensitive bicupin YhaK (pirin superfamily)